MREVIRFYGNKKIHFLVMRYIWINGESLANALNIDKQTFFTHVINSNLRENYIILSGGIYLTQRGVNKCFKKIESEETVNLKTFINKQVQHIKKEMMSLLEYDYHVKQLRTWERSTSIIYVANVGVNEVCIGATNDIVATSMQANYIFSKFMVMDVFDHLDESLTANDLTRLLHSNQ